MNPSEPILALKNELRASTKNRLAAVTSAEAEAAARKVADHVLALPEVAQARSVFTCLSFGPELDTRELVRRLLVSGRTVYVPRTDRRRKLLHLHPYPCPTKVTSFGLEEPRRDAPKLAAEAIDDTIDVALILGLAFDLRGFRLGYGAGYFDRFLHGRPFPTIGLAYGYQLVERLPVEPHDVPMSWVVTERGALQPS